MAKRIISGSRGIVTGASSGIGRAIAFELSRQGAYVFAVARREDRLAALVDDSRNAAGRILACCGDITQQGFRREVVERTAGSGSAFDFLVNAAGISSVARFADSSEERLRQITEVNFFAPAELIRMSLPFLSQGNRPLVANVGSILAHRGIPFHSDYCASKFALQGLSESIRPELRKQGIDLLIVSPGTTASELYQNDEGRTKLPWRQPRPVSAEYVAQQTVRAMASGKREIVPSLSGRMMLAANRWAPRLLDRWLGRYG